MTSQTLPPARWKADLALSVVALVWGSTFVIVKHALHEISTMYFLALRFSLASACMLLIFAPVLLRAKAKAVKRGIGGGAVAGIFLWLGYVLQTFGLKHTTAGNSGFLTGSYIVLVPLLSAALHRHWPQRREAAGIVIATAGMAALTVPSINRSFAMNTFAMNKGDLLTLGCALAFAIHLLVLGYYSQRELFQAVALGQIASTAAFSFIALLVEPPRVSWTSSVLVGLATTAVFATALAFALQTWGQKYTTATRTALIFALEPVFALATAVLAGHEALTTSALTGGALILAGILAVELKPAASREGAQKESSAITACLKADG